MQPALNGFKSFPILPEPDPYGKATRLHYAASQGKIEEVEMLLNDGLNINAKTHDGSTALHLAAQQEHETVCKLLIEKGADVNVKDDAGRTPLHIVCYTCFSNQVLKLLIEYGADANANMLNKRNGLHLLVAMQRPRLPFTQIPTNSPMVQLELDFALRQTAVCATLIRNGCDVRGEDYKRREPIFYAIIIGNFEVVDLLLGYSSAEVDDLLLVAVNTGYFDVIGLLLDSGADPNSQDSEGKTALQYSIEESDSNLTELLLVRGADPNIKSSAGQSALIRAVHHSDLGAISRLINLARIPVDVNITRSDGKTALEIAALDNLEITEMLLNAGAFYDKVRLATEEVSSLIKRTEQVFLAVIQRKYKMARSFINKGAIVNARQSFDGRSLLHYVAEGGDETLVRCLLKKGAETCFIDADGYNPLHLALRNNHFSIAELLIEHEINGSIRHPYDRIIFEEVNRQADLHTNTSEQPSETEDIKFATRLLQSSNHSMLPSFEPIFGSSSIVLFLDQVTTKEKNTALHLAAKSGHLDLVKLLIRSGAIYNKLNIHNLPPSHYATAEVREYLRLVERLFQLVKLGKDKQVKDILDREPSVVNAREASSLGTPLYCAIVKKHNHVARVLLKQGASVLTVCTKHYDTVLHIASTEGNSEIMEDLLSCYPFHDKSIFVNMRNCENVSPLCEAANADIARFLMSNGAIYDKKIYHRSTYEYNPGADVVELINRRRNLYYNQIDGSIHDKSSKDDWVAMKFSRPTCFRSWDKSDGNYPCLKDLIEYNSSIRRGLALHRCRDDYCTICMSVENEDVGRGSMK